MPRFYKGVGVGTHLHGADLCLSGLRPRDALMADNVQNLMEHIAGNTVGPYISLTRSYGVAEAYARDFGRAFPSASIPGYVYAIDLEYPTPPEVKRVLDPVAEIAVYINRPLDPGSYHHDGDMNFLLGIVNPLTMANHLAAHARQPRGATMPFHPPKLTKELATIVRALRDAEVIVFGSVPPHCVMERYPVEA
jgi:hypothetical protein